MNGIIFLIQDSPEGGYEARALGESIFTCGDDMQHLQTNIREAVQCHYEEGEAPKIIRLHFAREELIAV
ncbi:MAG: 2-oxoisovalerate dehydrogenase [Calditrichaeota bacterium]|nr:2-oxoisovalerate dehydrogenase [Calditrichota bacterium]